MHCFSDAVLAYLSKEKNKEYYVYILRDSRDKKIFYIGKGKGNRVFHHEQAAYDSLMEKSIQAQDIEKDLKMSTIRQIKGSGAKVEKVLINYGLSESQAFASENTLINFMDIVSLHALTNKVYGYGVRGIEVEKLESQFGFSPISITDVFTDKRILAVKITDSFNLDLNEEKDYDFFNKDTNNLKSRTLGNWRVSQENQDKIAYVIGVNTGIANSVVSAYKVSGTQRELDENGRYRTFFQTNSARLETLKELGLNKKALKGLRFGRGSAIAYIN
ncbi:LEM-3-like GIY-YIG domain-containing protein [Facklamia sp. P12934]|uniref:LEM-3-like GIY-YIG domain-containing protein n=1 Tax=Facklamia sp. P12934 TaxID=3421948 RepID=UPI003D17F9BF